MKPVHIVRITLYLMAGAVGVILWQMVSEQKKELLEIEQLAEIKALTIYGDLFSSKEVLQPEKRTALLFFHPECEYCRKELEGIIAHHQECRNVQWLFLTLASEERIQEFLLEYPLDSIADAYVLRENWPDTYVRYRVKGPPDLFIYDEHGKLMKHHKGATSIKTIVKELQ